MKDFPDFMKNPKNAIDSKSQSAGVKGYVFDGADGSQMTFWTCEKSGKPFLYDILAILLRIS